MANLHYAPEFRVAINDAPIPAALRASIARVSYQTGLEALDRVELTLANENLRWLDHPLLSLDGKLTLSLGYAPDPLTQVFVGEITGQTADFPANGQPSLTVVAQDRRHHLQQGEKVRWFAIPVASLGNFPLPDPLVASQVALESFFIPIVDPVGMALSVLLTGVGVFAALGEPMDMQKIIRKQDGESDYDFLTRISRENGWEMIVDHSGPLGGFQLRFMSALDQLEPVITLVYGRSLTEFHPRISTVGQIPAVTVKVWRPDIKMEFTVTVSWNWDRQSLDLSVVPGLGLPGAMEETPEVLQRRMEKARSPEARSQAGQAYGESQEQMGKASTQTTYHLVDEGATLTSASRKIFSKLIPRLNSRLTGSGSTLGDPQIVAGVVMRLEGLGEQFGGLYRVTSATHTLDGSGYQTSFELRKEIWFSRIPLPEQGAIPVSFQGQHLA